jgi:hypothetical protein
VSQPIRADQNASPEPDPLLAFFAEQSGASGSLKGDRAVSPEKPAGFAQRVERVEAGEPGPQVTDDLRLRIDRAERLVERSIIEITTLKSDLATLVSAVEDIKKRQSRRDAPPAPPAQPAKRISPWRAALAVIALGAAAAWGLLSSTSYDLFLR